MVTYNTQLSTIYPSLRAADPTHPSLACYPLEIVLRILEELFQPQQIIRIDIFGPEPLGNDADFDMEGETSGRTMIILRPPPLNTLAAVSRLFRYMYRKSRPTLWGAHLSLGRSYHVDLTQDIFYVRLHRKVHWKEWDRNGNPHLDPLAGVLAGIKHVAASLKDVSWEQNQWGMSYLRHLHPLCEQFLFLVPTEGVEKNHLSGDGLELSPVLLPLGYDDPVESPWMSTQMVPTWACHKLWAMMRILESQSLHLSMFTAVVPESWWQAWRLAPIQEIKGYRVDERRLNGSVARRVEELP